MLIIIIFIITCLPPSQSMCGLDRIPFCHSSCSLFGFCSYVDWSSCNWFFLFRMLLVTFTQKPLWINRSSSWQVMSSEPPTSNSRRLQILSGIMPLKVCAYHLLHIPHLLRILLSDFVLFICQELHRISLPVPHCQISHLIHITHLVSTQPTHQRQRWLRRQPLISTRGLTIDPLQPSMPR